MDGLLTPLEELSDLVNPEARVHERDLARDRPGRTFESFGGIRHAKQEELTPKQQSTLAFARELANHIEQGRARGEFDRLILVAPPAFLGTLRKNLSDSTRQTISREIRKNLVRENEEAIRQYLRL